MKTVQIKTLYNLYCSCREPGCAPLGSAQPTLLLNAPHAETARSQAARTQVALPDLCTGFNYMKGVAEAFRICATTSRFGCRARSSGYGRTARRSFRLRQSMGA